jgi:hypothetical protein
MSTLTQIKDAIKATMETVNGVGLVHTAERYDHSLEKLRTHYTAGGKLKGWYIRRTLTVTEEPRVGRFDVRHEFTIRGFQALVDANASELEFDLTIEDLRAAFLSDTKLGGTVNTTSFPDQVGLQLREAGVVMFAGVLCHSARLSLRTRHFEP